MNERYSTANPSIDQRPLNSGAYELALVKSVLAVQPAVTQPFRHCDLKLVARARAQEVAKLEPAPVLMSYPSFIVLLYVVMASVLGVSLWSVRDLFSMTELGLLGWCVVFAGGVIVDGCGKAIERLYDLCVR